MKIAMLGATRGIGRALARALAERGDELFLLGRNEPELAGMATDLALRRPSTGAGAGAFGHAECDLERPESYGPALALAVERLGGLDAVIVTAALFGTQDELEDDRERQRRLLDVDFARTVEFCEEARVLLLARGGGNCERGVWPAGS